MVHESEKVYHMCTTKWGEKPRFRPIFRGCGTVLVHKSQSVVHLFLQNYNTFNAKLRKNIEDRDILSEEFSNFVIDNRAE